MAIGEAFDGSGEVFLGRFTDGRNWVDYFPADAGRFGVQVSAVSAYFQRQTDNATDFAIGGATSGTLAQTAHLKISALYGLAQMISLRESIRSRRSQISKTKSGGFRGQE
jgi:hypothetical protein